MDWAPILAFVTGVDQDQLAWSEYLTVEKSDPEGPN
jgi:hypothetical protein